MWIYQRLGAKYYTQTGGYYANVGDDKDNYAKGDILTNFENIIGSNASSTSTGYDDNGSIASRYA